MAMFAHTRPGTSASFWRHHNAQQDKMIRACTRSQSAPAVAKSPVPAATLDWMPTAAQRSRYQGRRVAFTEMATRAH